MRLPGQSRDQLLVELDGHRSQLGAHILDLVVERVRMTNRAHKRVWEERILKHRDLRPENRRVDELQGLVRGEVDAEHAEQRDEARIDVVAATACSKL